MTLTFDLALVKRLTLNTAATAADITDPDTILIYNSESETILKCSFSVLVQAIATAMVATPRAGAFTTLTASGDVSFNGSNASISYAPTGTGTVTINPAGASTINNCSVGATTAASGKFTTLQATSTVTFTPSNSSLNFSPTGTGVVTINPGAVGSMNNMTVGLTTPKDGKFANLTATVRVYVNAGIDGGDVPGHAQIGYSATDGAMIISQGTAGDVTLFDRNGNDRIRTYTSGVKVNGTILTTDPTSGVGPQWKLGAYKTATVTLNTANYVEVEVGGTLRKLAVVT